jgi:hypothetical protein
MNWIKAISIISTSLLILLISSFYWRNDIAIWAVNRYLSEQNFAPPIQLDCIDFSINRNADLVFDQLCINNSLASLNLRGLTVNWTLARQPIVNSALLDNLTITANGPLPIADKKASASQPFSVHDFHQLMNKISTFTLPATVRVKQLSYQPLGSDEKYQGHLWAKQNRSTTIDILLKNAQADDIFSAQFTSKNQSFKGAVMVDLQPMVKFLTVHKLGLPEQFAQAVAFNGKFNSVFEWQKDQFTADSSLNDFSVTSDDILSKSLLNKALVKKVLYNEPLSVNATLAWQIRLDDQMLHLTFNDSDTINIAIDNKAVIDALTAQHAAPAFISLIKDNPTQGLVIQPKGHWQYDFSAKQFDLSQLTLANRNPTQPMYLQLSNWAITLADTTISGKGELNSTIKAKVTALHSPSDQPADITLNSQIKYFALTSEGLELQSQYSTQIKTALTSLQPYSNQPVRITAKGSITKTLEQLKVRFDPSSQLVLNQLAVKQPIAVSATENLTDFSGEVILDNNQSLTLDLKVNNALSQLNIRAPGKKVSAKKSLAKIALTQVTAAIKGSLNDINITGDVITDELALMHFELSGEVTKPTFALTTKDLELTDALTSGLAIGINQMATIDLIGGVLNVKLSGQLTEPGNISQNELQLAVALEDITGTVNDTWFEELYWQQHFTIINNTIISQPLANNFSLAMVEAGTPITTLLATTNLSFVQQTFSGELDNVSGSIFGGGFSIPKAYWPLTAQPPLMVDLAGIDLAKVVALEKQKGITITGKVSGHLPVTIKSSGVTIDGGELHNVSEGVIQIMNNPAVVELKKSRTELKLAFDALQNLHYHQLTSLVTMTNEGQMLLETAIKGINPDLDNEVNFNLDLDYDLLGLIESLRITDKFEQQINETLDKEGK